MTFPRLLIALLLAPALSCLALADDWSGYRGSAGNGVSKESLDSKGGSLEVLWKSATPLGFSSFAVAQGRAITVIAEGEQAFCVALDTRRGTELWRAKLGSTDYGRGGGDAGAPGNRGGDGPRSTPAIDGGLVYTYDAHLVLRCHQADSGRLVWQQDVAANHEGRNIKWANASSPVVDGNWVIVGGGGAGQSILAFDKKTGKLGWKSGDETITHATPVVANIRGRRQIVFLVQSGLVSFDVADGRELWRAEFPFSTSSAASPVVSGNLVYCSAGYGVGASVFEVNADGSVDEVWFEPNQLMNHWSTPVVKDGYLYGIFEFKKYGRAPLQCVELATGEIKWAERGFGPGNCVLVGDRLVVLSDAGEVAIVDATPSGYQELARTKAIEGKCWSTPAFADGRIYVRSTKEAACLSP